MCKSSGIPSAGRRALLFASTNNTQFLCLYSCLFIPCIINQAAEDLVCGVVLHRCKGKNSILCFVRTPTRCVWRCPGAVLGIGEDQRQRKMKLCICFAVWKALVQSVRVPSALLSHLRPQGVPWICITKFLPGEMGAKTLTVRMVWCLQPESVLGHRIRV